MSKNSKKKKLTLSSAKGFTLIETMVSVIVFTVVASLALGVFLSTVRSQRFALQRQRLITETSYALDRYVQELREMNSFANVEEEDIRSRIEDLTSLSSVDISVSIEKRNSDRRITILLETETKVEEEQNATAKIQTTVFSGN